LCSCVIFFWQWDLVCDRNVLPEASQMVFNFGVMFGAILFGFLSDKFGRKRTFVTSLVVQAVVGSVTALSPNFYVFTALRFIVGALEQVRCTPKLTQFCHYHQFFLCYSRTQLCPSTYNVFALCHNVRTCIQSIYIVRISVHVCLYCHVVIKYRISITSI